MYKHTAAPPSPLPYFLPCMVVSHPKMSMPLIHSIVLSENSSMGIDLLRRYLLVALIRDPNVWTL